MEKEDIQEELNIIEEQEGELYDIKDESEKIARDKLVKVLKQGIEVSDLEQITSDLTPSEIQTTEYRAHFEKRQDKIEEKVNRYIRAHKHYFAVPFIIASLVFLFMECMLADEKIISITNSLHNKRILVCFAYASLIYFITTLITFCMVERHSNIFKWFEIDWFWRKNYHSALGVNFYNSFEFSDPEKEGLTILQIRNKLEKYYNFQLEYEECLEFLNKQEKIKKHYKEETKETVYGVRFKHKES